MRKRPLCLIAVLLFLILLFLPEDIWLKKPDIPSGEKVYLTGIVKKREQKEEKQAYYLKSCLCDQTEEKISVLAYTSTGISYPIGCELSLYGTIYQLNEADNPGQFDQRSYYQSQGILYTFQAETVLRAEGCSRIREAAVRLREFFAGCLERVFDERDSGILTAMILGDKSGLQEDDRLLYQKNGISHLLAISGVKIQNLVIPLTA